jgi:murein DD-endopeptidase MepM/ murein hydrolase activator NlpD
MVVSRHRSPKGRRAHHGTPLSALVAAAGSGGAHRSIPLPSVFPTPMHAVAAVVVGGTLAAAAQQAFTTVLPAVDDGASAVRASLDRAIGVTQAAATVTPVAPEPPVADASSLIKAADLQKTVAEERAVRAATAAAPALAAPAVGAPAVVAPPVAARPPVGAAAPPVRAAPATPFVRPAPAAPAAAGGAVRILSGPVTSGFGGRWGTVHEGLDIAAPIGTPIHVPLAGVVISSGPASGFGLWVRVQHSDGTITVYGHINRSFVQVGQRVATGQVIAETGNRGQSTGPHLHIGVMQNGVYINPKPWLDARGIHY